MEIKLKKKNVISMLAAIFLLTIEVGMYRAIAEPDGPLTVRYEATGRYDIVAGGVGLYESNLGDIILDVPGSVVKAYLYWSGFGSNDINIDNTVIFTVGSSVNTLTADWTFGPDPWWDGNYHKVYVEEVTSLILTGINTYTISDVNIEVNYGAGLMVVYEDTNLPYNLVQINDGLDAFHFRFSDPRGPNSDVTSFDFGSASYDRYMDIILFVGGVQHDDRPNAIWYQSGTGSKPDDLVDDPDAIELDGPPWPYPLGAYDGQMWDTYSRTVTVPKSNTWACVQIESVESYDGAENEGLGASALFTAVGFVLKTPPGTGTPGYWKNHPDAWPVNEIIVGGVTYTRDDAIEIMKTPGKGDKTYTMFSALVAAKLNVFIGNPSGCIDETITDADAWMAVHPVGSGVKAKSDPWQVDGESFYEMLDDYNNGLLCAPPRD
jgi:hypothetical protein